MLVVSMAGKGGKHSHRKGNPIYNKSDTINKMTEVTQTSNFHPDGSRDPNDMNLEAVVNFELPTSQDQLLKSGYSKAEVESAILHAGSVLGEMDFLNNVCQNTIAYIEKKAEPRTESFKNPVGLYTCALETMVESLAETQRKRVWHLLAKNWGFGPSTITLSHQRSRDKSSIWFRESSVSSSHSRNEDICSSNPSSAEKVTSGMQIDSSSKKVGLLERIDFTVGSLSHLRLTILIHTDVVQWKIEDPVIRLQAFPCVTSKPTKVPNIMRSDFLRSFTDYSNGTCHIGCLEGDSDDPKAALIVDLVKNIRELHEKVNEQKEWAKVKVIGSTRKVSKDLLELKMLRSEEFNKELNKQERIYIEKSCILMLIETEQGLQNSIMPQ